MTTPNINDFKDFAKLVDYSLMNNLNADPDATADGIDHDPRQVFSGHFVPVAPTPIENPEYIIHSKTFFKELGLSDELAFDPAFQKVFSADLSVAPLPMHKFGWATGYALSIYGTEYTAQCPFRTGNGYGDGRAISIFEGKFNNQRFEMQLKGGGPTPYCRGADGRAVLRSSIREFLAQEYMHALGVPTSRSLCLYASKTETVARPWYSDGSKSNDPDIMVDNPVAITTRVAPSFLRVGQLELFARRTRDNAHPKAIEELKMIVTHLIEREYSEVDRSLPFEEQIIELALAFQGRLTGLIANWLRVGYCQGNFNSDNCAAGGFTLDYGPFGFCETFDPAFQPWTGGGRHFSFFNQPKAAELNFEKFISALAPLLKEGSSARAELEQVCLGFETAMHAEFEKVWRAKLGLISNEPELFQSLILLMIETKVDYTIFFRELSNIPENILPLKKSFYSEVSQESDNKWQAWLEQWRALVLSENSAEKSEEVSKRMKKVNPKYAWREWLIVPAYQQAARGDYSLIHELQEVLSHPFDEQSKDIEEKYYRLKPKEFFKAGGVSHYSCSS
ncbi:MAG: protein adenylyltransferase SelO family protein [Bacteriovoracaceae bacterium]|nr:protein adenylyltransferase SelO family protein [Bacteriovoracaceae bacterium]